jgi:hypothetical protein
LDGFLSTADLFRIVKYASFFHSFDPINKNVIFLHDLNQNKNKFGMAVPLTINEEKVF